MFGKRPVPIAPPKSASGRDQTNSPDGNGCQFPPKLTKLERFPYIMISTTPVFWGKHLSMTATLLADRSSTDGLRTTLKDGLHLPCVWRPLRKMRP